jgi:hypothetical protein
MLRSLKRIDSLTSLLMTISASKPGMALALLTLVKLTEKPTVILKMDIRKTLTSAVHALVMKWPALSLRCTLVVIRMMETEISTLDLEHTAMIT